MKKKLKAVLKEILYCFLKEMKQMGIQETSLQFNWRRNMTGIFLKE
jgi:hypothetical protein